MRRLTLGVTLAALLGGCSAEQAEEPPAKECKPLAFRQCETDACRGAQQCATDGSRWSRCACTVLDASFDVTPIPKDASGDGPAEASDALPDVDISDAGDADTSIGDDASLGDAAAE